MYWGGRGAPESILINFELELNKEYVLGEEGRSREDVNQSLNNRLIRKDHRKRQSSQDMFLNKF